MADTCNGQANPSSGSQLDERDKAIISMRFGAEMTQSEIGAVLGVSQMQVSRLLSRTLGRLRDQLLIQD